jgi:hypothetical protein
VFVQEHLSKHFLRDYAKKREEKERGESVCPWEKTSRSLFSFPLCKGKIKRVLSIPL